MNIKHLVEQLWLPAVVVVGWVAWLLRSARRLSRPSAPAFKPPRHAKPNHHITAPFRRDEFAARAEIDNNRMAKAVLIPGAILLVGPPTLMAITWFVPTLPPGFFETGASTMVWVGIASISALVLRATVMTHRDGLICPACGRELVGRMGSPRGNMFYMSQPPWASRWSIQDRVLMTGECPGCGAQLLDPTEVGPISRTSTRAAQAWGIVLIAALLALLVAYVYFGNQYLDAKRLARCHSRYARAHSALDSAAVDSTQVTRGELYTCGELRRSK
jgi:hypothetical protein